MTKIEIGTKTIHMYGAYYPERSGLVVDINGVDVVVAYKDLDDNIVETTMGMSSLRNDYMKPAGSPIGVYVDPELC